MRTDITRQPISLILLQFILFLGLFAGRYFHFPLDSEAVPAGISLSVQNAPGHYVSPGMLINSTAAGNPLAGQLLSALLLFINGFLITKTMSRNLVFPARTYLPYLIYLLAGCGIYFSGHNLSAVLAAYLIMHACSTFINSYSLNPSFGITFKGAFILGITPLLHPQTAVYFILVPVATRIFRKSGRETIVAMFGYALPTLIATYTVWALGGNGTEVYNDIRNGLLTASHINMDMPLPVTDIVRLAVCGLFAVTVIISTGSLLLSASEMRTRAYRIQSLMLVFLGLAIAVLASPFRTAGDLAITAIPVSFIMPHYFVKYPGKVSATLYVLLLTGVAVLNILPFLLQP